MKILMFLVLDILCALVWSLYFAPGPVEAILGGGVIGMVFAQIIKRVQ